MLHREKAYANVKLQLTSLQMIWLQHSGYLDKIARMFYINYYYNEDSCILTSGDKSYCQRAIQEINQLLYEEFVMEIHKFNNYQEITPFIDIFHTQQFMDIRTQFRGFWIYTFSSLYKQQRLMRETKGYVAQLPELPNYFLIIWFPIEKIKQIKQDLFQMTGYQFDKIKTPSSTRVIKPLSALEALSIFLILDIQQISEEQNATFILQQDHDQFSIIIQSTSNIQEAFNAIEAHINRRKFWQFFNVNQQYISELQIQINDVISTAAGVKLFTKEEVIKEAYYLDKMFNIDLSGLIIRNSRSDMIYVYSDQQKQEEINEKLIVLVRKLNSLQYDKQPQSTPQQIIKQPENYYFNQYQFSYQPNYNNNSPQIFNYEDKFQNYNYNRKQSPQNKFQYQQDYDINVQKQQTKYYQNKTYQHKPKFIYTPKYIEPTNLDQSPIPQQQTGDFFSPQQSEVQPLKNYKKNNKNTQFEQNNQYEQNKQFEYNKQQKYIIDAPPIKYEYVYKRDLEESKLSQLIQIEEVSNYIECQILKIEILSYQLIYQTNKSCYKKINFLDFQTSLQKYANQNYSPCVKSINYMQTYLEIDLIVDSESEYQQIKQLFHKYFNQTKYYVTIASETPQNFVKTFENQFDVEVMRTDTDYHGYINHEQFKELTINENGYNIVIIIKNYTLKDEEVILSKLEGFEIHYQFLMNSSIIDTSKSNNQVGIVLLSNEQIEFLLQNYPQLDCKVLKKFRQLMKIDFSFAQIENDKSFAEAKIELSQINKKYIEDYIKSQIKDTQDKFVMKRLKSNTNNLAYKIYVLDNIQAFYTSLLEDKLNMISQNEYKKDKPIYYEASINIGKEKFSDELLNNLFKQSYSLQRKNSMLDIPKFNFLTVMIRSEYGNALTTEELSYKNMLIRGYIQTQ